MPKGVKVLTDEQEGLLRDALDCHLLYVTVKSEAEREASDWVRRKTSGYLSSRNGAIQDAVNGGVPKARIQEHVLGTKSWLTLENILKGGDRNGA